MSEQQDHIVKMNVTDQAQPTLPQIELSGEDDIVVIAKDPAEMVAAQGHLVEAFERKLVSARADVADADALLTSLLGAGMAVAPAERLLNKHAARVTFLEKCIEALRAGYLLMPDFPAETIAVRVKRKPPRRTQGGSTWTPNLPQAESQGLAVGEGEYARPALPEDRWTETIEKEGGKSEILRYVMPTGEYDTDIALPALFLKPTIIQRTGKMLARRIFDEVAISPGDSFQWSDAQNALKRVGGSAGDPVVIGRVVNRATKQRLCFLVAWFVDTKGL